MRKLSLAGLAALLCCACATPSDRAGPGDPLPSVILSPEAEAAQSCPIGAIPGRLVPPDRVESAMSGHLPRSLPRQFGLAAAWEPVGATDTAGAAWADPRCRTVRIVLDPHAAVGSGPQVGEWSITASTTCGNGLLQAVPCLEYRTQAAGTTIVLSTVGLAREEGDAVASSVRLE